MVNPDPQKLLHVLVDPKDPNVEQVTGQSGTIEP
jgi:hypothetical protein